MTIERPIHNIIKYIRKILSLLAILSRLGDKKREFKGGGIDS